MPGHRQHALFAHIWRARKQLSEAVVKCQVLNIPKPMDLSMSDNWVIKGNEWKHVLSKNTVGF